MQIKDKICLIVVLYNPKIEQIRNVEAMSALYSVVAVDNSNEISPIKGVNYISLHQNKGIAAAQNEGIRFAKKQGFKYIILLDQDSKIDESFVLGMYEDFQKIKKHDSTVGFLGPVIIDEQTHTQYKNYTRDSESYHRVSAVIASGSLISVEAIDASGLMDESLFIDLVDFEWCWRAIMHGYSGYMTRNVKMVHTIGKEYHNWHGFILGLSSPFRYYYQYRNTLWLIRRGYVPIKWKIKSVFRRTLDMFIVPIISEDGWKVFKYMIKGFFDGIIKKNAIVY